MLDYIQPVRRAVTLPQNVEYIFLGVFNHAVSSSKISSNMWLDTESGFPNVMVNKETRKSLLDRNIFDLSSSVYSRHWFLVRGKIVQGMRKYIMPVDSQSLFIMKKPLK